MYFRACHENRELVVNPTQYIVVIDDFPSKNCLKFHKGIKLPLGKIESPSRSNFKINNMFKKRSH